MNSAPAPAPAPSNPRNSGEGSHDPRPHTSNTNSGPHRSVSPYNTNRPQNSTGSSAGPARPPRGPHSNNGPRSEGPRSSTPGGRPGRVSRQIQRTLRRPSPTAAKKTTDYFPDTAPDNVVRIIPLGGVEEVGRNMIAVETQGEIFVFDAGFQFVSEESAPGVDYMLPNTKFLEQNADRVKAVFITHGHLDHIGAIPFIMNRFGNPPIYTRNLSAVMIQKRQEEYPDMPAPNLIVVEPGSTHTVGKSRVYFFPVTHSITDSMGISI
jgi:hypothetical protein